jgi:bis(5'-nucleosidyl)-tetraphosphatase
MEESFGIIPIRKTKEGYLVFLVKLKSGNHWGFPKGHGLNSHESPKEIALRELKEETNLEIKDFFSKLSFKENYSFQREDKKVDKQVIYFLGEVLSADFKLQKEEILEGGWFSLTEAEKKLTYQGSKKICQKVKAYLEEK